MRNTLTLANLLSGQEHQIRGPRDLRVSGVAYDSRQVVAGDLFVAVPGFVHDGLRFAPDAVRRGAVAVVSEAGPEGAPEGCEDVAWVHVPDARAALAHVACRIHGDPSQELAIVGVTGTNGKTTVAALVEAILGADGPVGRWSTTTVRIAGEASPALHTTPEAPDLQRALRRMVDAGCRAAAIEVSSHALALRRTDGTRFAAAVFTNLSVDHLDFHGDLDGYLEAKALLFRGLDEEGVAVVNVDEAATAPLLRGCRARVVGFGWHPEARRTAWPAGRPGDGLAGVPVEEASGPGAPGSSGEPAGRAPAPDYRIRSWHSGEGSSLLALDTPQGAVELSTPLFGPASAENLAAAVAATLELGAPVTSVRRAVAAFAGEPGRFQAVDAGQPFRVLVDYAHTPAALEAALAAARSVARRGRLLVVFGCGGDRDRGKRPVMGRVAAAGADVVVLTSDNPRSEDPEAILDAVASGVPEDDRHRVRRCADRRAAIELALADAGPGDCVLVAGKGHESEQVFADRTVPFDDADVARRILAGHAAGSEVSR